MARFALQALALAGLAPLMAAAQVDGQAKLFRMPTDPDAELRAQRALEFAVQERWAQAVEELHALVAEYPRVVLPQRFGEADRSQFDLHPGAATWALGELERLPSVARDRYRERFGPEAAAGLADARSRGDGQALVEVGRRYPLTDAGVQAWFAVGDLELEQGNIDACLAAWRRGLAQLETIGAPLPAGPERRVAVMEDLAKRQDENSADRALRAGLGLPGSRSGIGSIPLAESDRWVLEDLDLEPFHGTRRSESYNLFPALAGDKLLVSSSMRLYCFDAFTSALLWASDTPEGWDNIASWVRPKLFEGIDRSLCLVAPAAGSDVAVAALQVPFANSEDHDYQGIEILTPIPERRLHAFDLETGEPLWDHAPPLDWDGEGGPYEQLMLVAAPPVVAGSRVLVPCYRMRGRILFQVACYDLHTGKRLWSTSLVSGQRELNMFGRQTSEFCGAPVVVEDDGVFVLTQLGTVARIDLFTGRIVWESRYEQIDIPKNHGWTTSERDVVWRNAPPVVTEEVVIATPHDSYLLLGIDKRDGQVLWAFENDRLPAASAAGEKEPVYSSLLGASHDTVYLGGTVVSALVKPGGLRFEGTSLLGRSRRASFTALWSVPVTGGFSRLPRPVLGDEEVLIPMYDERVVVDRRNGRRRESRTTHWSETERGNVLIGHGMLVTLGNRRLSGFFDWELLLRRAEESLAAHPGDLGVRLNHAELLLRRAKALEYEGRPDRARPLTSQARESLEGVLLGAAGGAGSVDPRIAQSLHAVLRHEARLCTMEADTHGALSALTDALALARSGEDIRDTLLDMEQLLPQRDPERWRAILEQLERRVGHLPMPRWKIEGEVAWLMGESLLTLTPTDIQDAEVPVGLWVLLRRADASARSREYARALGDLHEALARHGDRKLAFSLTVRDVVSSRIARRLEMDGREPYAAFEERAARLLDEALAVESSTLLTEVGRLYPHAQAARRAEEIGLEWALLAEDPAASAALAFRAYSHEKVPTPKDAEILVRLAAVLREAGNARFERALLADLGRDLPQQTSDLPAHGDRTFAELARALDAQTGVTPRPLPTFDENLSRAAVLRGSFEWMGAAVLNKASSESPPVTLFILSERNRLVGMDSLDTTRIRWSHDLRSRPSTRTVAITDERVIAAVEEGVVGLDTATGGAVWSWKARDHEVSAVAASAGMVVVLTSTEDPQTGFELQVIHALDAFTGVPLWSLPAGERTGWLPPICGEGLAVFLLAGWSEHAPVLIIDLFRGRVLAEMDLGDSILADSWSGAWIEDGKLIVPYFSASRKGMKGVQAFDLRSAETAWSLALDSGQELWSIAVHAETSYLVVLPVSTNQAGSAGVIASLDVRRGQLRKIASLRRDENTMGLPKNQRTVLHEPYLFTYTARPGSQTIPIKMIALDGSPGWVRHLPLPFEELENRGLPRPAISADIVAIAYMTRSPTNLAQDGAHIELVDRSGGFRRSNLLLSPEMSKMSVRVYGLGDSLLILGSGISGNRNLSQIEVMQSAR